MSIKTKALFIVSLIILVMSGFFLFQGIAQYDKEVRWLIQEEEKIIENTLQDIGKYSFYAYGVRIKKLSENNHALKKAFAGRDRQLLLKISLPIYNDLMEENKYVHAMDFTLPDGTVFLRVQNPELYGDKLDTSRTVVQAVHDDRKQHAGYDIGRHGAMYWIASPLYHEGKYAGAMEVGIHVEQLVHALEARFKTEVTAVFKSGEWQKATSPAQEFRRFGDYVMMTHPGSIYEEIPEDLILKKNSDITLKLKGKMHVLHSCAVLKNQRGEPIGNILTLQDISNRIDKKAEFIRTTLIITVLLLIGSLLVFHFTFGRLLNKLEKYAEQLRKAKNEIEKTNSELENRVKERTGELAKTNAMLHEQHEFLLSTIESLSHPFYVIDAESYRIILANRASYSGQEVPPNTTCYNMTHGRNEPCTGDDHPCSITEIIKTKKPVVLEHVHVNDAGGKNIFEIYAYPILDEEGRVSKVIEYCIDITEKKKAEEDKEKMTAQLLHLQKMEAIGTLAGGIAHDFNNILMGMIGYCDMARYSIPEESEAAEMLDNVLNAGKRAKYLVQQILSFSRQSEQMRVTLKIQEAVEEALKLLRASIPTTIEFRRNIDPKCGPVLADATQIHQVIMNLCTNAYHAMREKGGVLGISLKCVEIRKDGKSSADLMLSPNEYVKLEISDTGHGMGPSVLKRIFEPFFTTKELGEGTGMGLAVVHGIVKSHGGHITVYSEPDIGTTFNVYLPVLQQEDGRREEGPSNIRPSFESLPRGNERIMIVDDEEEIVTMGRQLLEKLGYSVITFTKPLDALESFRNGPDAFDLVITDMTMPVMTGTELARRILALRKDMPVILCTGFSELINGDSAKALGISEYLMKPILISEIASTVRKVLDEKGQHRDA